MRRLPLALVAVLVGLLAALPLQAGQVRVDVTNNAFVPQIVTANPGDHIVWVWKGDNHSVTSGTDGSTTGDGKFATDVMTAGNAFSWKSPSTPGTVPYYCWPHFAIGMTGTINLSATSAPAADFRITEVQYNTAIQHDLIEITNFGNATGNLGRYRFVTPIDTVIVPLDDFPVPANGRVIVHVNVDGTQSAPSDLYLSQLLDLDDVAGSLSLLVPNTNPTTSSPSRVDQIIDFVQWGAAHLRNEAVAAAAGIWTAGEYRPTMQYGQSLEFCGTASQHGATYWNEVAVPNFGVDGHCSTTPTLNTTWGRIKTIYR